MPDLFLSYSRDETLTMGIISFAAYAGQTVNLHFEAAAVSSVTTSFFMDDIALK